MDPNAPPQDPGSLILVDKPPEWTSFDVVKKLKYALKVKKIGHAGTLDPLATGLLILCTGKMTKQIETFQSQEKEYTGTFFLGKSTPSYDRETEVNDEKSISLITIEDIIHTAKSFMGIIDQVPPIYSAIKVDGKRAYKSARAGEDVKLKSRQVEIKDFEITEISLPEVHFRIVCSKGTYIRSMARDFGLALDNIAHLHSLRRTRIGEFHVESARTIEEITKG